ncbi:MAG: cob(I)yrinic acid a,c-diamide adenosyltransferase [Candidatus Marinimicrobia bacterium]|nr:cob(I)yrinic acid a,c-diamide adenosyltransferase [Candidatus Neomarinimicrobiota bacterium]
MRLTKIYTRTGDKGKTRLADGTEVSKDSDIIHVSGEIDELNSMIGVVLAQKPSEIVADALLAIQHHLFDLGGQISSAGTIPEMITRAMVKDLEQQMDRMNAELSPLEEFILPGGTLIAANLHLARTICRRAERSIISLNRTHTLSAEILGYMNRLSDCLFVMARFENHVEGNHEVYWKNPRSK